MEAENVLNLLDSYWYNLDFFKRKPSSSSSNSDPHHKIPENSSSNSEIPTLPTIHTNSPKLEKMSSNYSLRSDSASPNSVLFSPKLQTIFSGKISQSFVDPRAGKEFQETPTSKATATVTKASPLKGGRAGLRRKKKGLSKSMSELDFDELKGFMDLGFVFSEEDKDSNLASILPGLQKLGNKPQVNDDEYDDDDEVDVTVDDEDEYEDDKNSRKGESFVDKFANSRPYPSETWERKKKENPQMKWRRVPAFSSEIDMKDYLRLWAHSVASTVTR